MIGGYEHEWPPAFESFVARELVGRDAVDLVRLGDLAEAPRVLGTGLVSALVVQAERLGLKELLLLQECRRVSPGTALVVVATTGRSGMKSALEGGATAFLSWPASPEAVRQALRSGSATADGADGPGKVQRVHAVVGGRMDEAVSHSQQDPATDRASSGGEAVVSRREQLEAVLALAALDAQLRQDAAPQRRRPGLEAQRATTRERLPAEVVALYDRALRACREPLVVRLVSGTCSGCYLQLATGIAQRVRRGRTLAACPHCGRLLYESADAAPASPAGHSTAGQQPGGR